MKDRSDCWLWARCVTNLDYGRVNGHLFAHRAVYEALVGNIPVGYELDHLCRVPRCVNPAHLEPVTHRENMLRGKTVAATNASKTQCKRGHEFEIPSKSQLSGGARRFCRKCDVIRNLAYRQRKRERVEAS